jgi:hypothetical protein
MLRLLTAQLPWPLSAVPGIRRREPYVTRQPASGRSTLRATG